MIIRIIFFLIINFWITLLAHAESVTLSRIIIEAPPGFDLREITSQLTIREGGTYAPTALNDELKALYLTGKYQNIQFEPLNQRNQTIDLKIIVDPKLKISNITFKGNDFFSSDELTAISKLKPDSEWSQELLDQSVQLVISAYQDAGYYQIRVEPTVLGANKPLMVDLSFKISEGNPAKIVNIIIDGAPPLLAPYIKGQLDLTPGDVFTDAALKTGVDSIRQKLFEENYLEAEISPPQVQFLQNRSKVVIKLYVTVGPQYQFRFKGNQYFSASSLGDLIVPPEEELFGPISLEDVLGRIIREYKLSGFHFVTAFYSIKENAAKNLKVVEFNIQEGPRVTIVGYSFPDVVHFSQAFYQDYILTHATPLIKKGFLNVPDLEIALDATVDFLHSKGFLNAALKDYKLRFSEDQKSVEIVVHIDEGVQTRIASINFTGNSHISTDNLKEIIDLKLDTPLTYYQVAQAERAILRHYQEQGHYYASIKETEEFPRVFFRDEGKLADVHFVIQEGEIIRFGEAVIRGQEMTKEEFIRRELTFKPGDILTPSTIRKSENNISRTALFQSVVIRPLNPDPAQTVKRMLVLVKERNPGLVEFGAGLASDDGPRGFAGVAYRNVMGWNRTVSARVEINRPLSDFRFWERFVNIGFIEPYLFDIPFVFRLNLINLKEQGFSFDEERLEAATTLEKIVGEPTKATLRYSFASRNVTPINTEGEQEKDSLLALLGPSIYFDFRDDPYNPTRGNYDSITLDYSEPALGSQEGIRFIRLVGNTNFYFSLFNYFTLATGLNLGYLKSLTSEDITVDQRFYLGGRRTIRGFKEQSLGVVPEGFTGPIRESYYLNPRIELRFPLWWGFEGALFYDGGNVFFVNNGLPREWKGGVGPSLRFRTPIGPLSLDFGINVDPEPGEDRFRASFDIGTF